MASRRRQVSFLLGKKKKKSQEGHPSIPISSVPPEGALPSSRAETRGLRSKGRTEGRRPRGLWGVTFPAPRRWDQGRSEQHRELDTSQPGSKRPGPWLAMKAEGTETQEVGSQWGGRLKEGVCSHEDLAAPSHWLGKAAASQSRVTPQPAGSPFSVACWPPPHSPPL